MKTTRSLKTVAFALGLAAMGLTAGNLNAQTGGGLFGRGAEMESAGTRDGLSGFNITTGQFGGDGGQAGGDYGIGIGTFGQDPPESPLGSGLFIMAAAGAAYAFSKKRKKQEVRR
jgi:hypothetical protein